MSALVRPGIRLGWVARWRGGNVPRALNYESTDLCFATTKQLRLTLTGGSLRIGLAQQLLCYWYCFSDLGQSVAKVDRCMLQAICNSMYRSEAGSAGMKADPRCRW